eukprot:4879037-Prymnesium_polylepis.1
MMLCSAATLHLAVDARISPSNRVVPPGRVARRPQFKAGSGPSSRHTARERRNAHRGEHRRAGGRP